MQEGICKNCGSIVFVDPKEEKCHCLFCDCVFPAKEALEIAKDPSAHTFPNEKQPEYIPEGKAGQKANYEQAFRQAAQAKRAEAVAKKRPQYEIKTKALPDVNLSAKQVLSMVAILALVVGLFLALILPMTQKRDLARRVITDEFQTRLKASSLDPDIDYDKGFAISHMDNSRLDLVAGKEISESDTKELFEIYHAARALAGGDTEASDSTPLSLRVAVPEKGGFSIDLKTIDEVRAGQGITKLP